MRSMAMSDSKINEFLTEHRFLRLATVSENGWPHVVPVAYTRIDQGKKLYILSHPEQRKYQNIFHNNQVGVVVDDGETYTTLRGVFIHGYATVVRDDDLIETIEPAWVGKVYNGRLPDVVRAAYSMRDAWLWFEIDPANVVSWDISKLDEARLREENQNVDNPFTYCVPNDVGAAEPELT